MGIMSEIATENTIKSIVEEIKKDLLSNTNFEACKALRKLGRFVLGQFEWSTPEWVEEYVELFKE